MNIFFQRKEWLSKDINISHGLCPYLILITTSFFVYIKTICPTIYWRDAPEFVNVGYTLGIAHPSGSPAYSLISKIITFVPIGSIAFKINIVSLLFAICSVLILFKIILLLIELCFEEPDKTVSWISAMLAALIVVFSPSFWMNAVVAEVYTMNIFCLCLIIYFFIRWVNSRQMQFLFLSTFLYGISAGVHGGMLVFSPVFFLFFLIVEFQKSKKPFETVLLVAFFFLLGFSVFLFLPVRSVTNPTFDWGDPETFFRFVNHITDRKDSTSFFSDTGRVFSFVKNIGLFSKMFSNEFTCVGILFGVIGLLIHVKKHKTSFLLLLSLFLVNIFFYFSTTYKSFSNSILFLPSLIIFSFWIGTGIFTSIKTSARFLYGNYFKIIFFTLLPGCVMFLFLKNYNEMNKSDYYLAEDNAKLMYLAMESNSIVFSKTSWFSFRFLKDVENLRSDLIIILITDLENPSLFNYVRNERFPSIMFPNFESDKDNFYAFVPSLIKLNFDKRHIYADFDKSLNRVNGIEILPHRWFLSSISLEKNKNRDNLVGRYLLTLNKTLIEDINSDSFIFDQVYGARNSYGIYLMNLSDYLIMKKRYKDAEQILKIAAYINKSADKNIMEMLGVCYINQERFKEAEILYQDLVKNYSEDYEYLYSLGIVSMKTGKMDQAKQYLEKSIALNSNFEEARFALEQVNQNFNK